MKTQKTIADYFKKYGEWTIHGILWTFLIGERWFDGHPMALEESILSIFSIIPIFYVTAFVLIPLFFRKKKWFRFLAGLVLLCAVSDILRSFIILATLQLRSIPFNFEYEFWKWSFDEYRSFDRFIFSSNLWSVYLSFSYVLIRDWIMNEKIRTRLESEKVEMELAFLKAQIDPHFLFNTLNNLYALALEEEAPRTADMVTKIGTLMRYSLHDSQADKILLSKEIDYIGKYVELEKLRLTDAVRIKLEFDFPPGGLSTEMIAPMILMPFIENAFKHGISLQKGSDIVIDFSLAKELFTLTVTNSLHERSSSGGGIGLNNVGNRLQLIYPNKHKLMTQPVGDSYQVRLEIDLRK